MPHAAFDRARSGINALHIKSAAFKIASSVTSARFKSFNLEFV
jgi:hypothetical protein